MEKQANLSLGAQYISKDDVKLIVTKYGFSCDDTYITHYEVRNAGDNKLLGFLGDYFKLKIKIKSNNEEKVLNLFIKAIPRSNAAKASFVEDVKLYDKELKYYELINGVMKVPGLKPWSAKFVTALKDLVVLDDLYALKYKMRNKHTKFDEQHTVHALNTLARMHSSTFIFEDKRSRELQRPYRVDEDYGKYLAESIFTKTDPWFSQCRDGSLEIVKLYSKYSQDRAKLQVIESRWCDVFNSALTLSESSEDRTVISHRDLWNNNMLFHYSDGAAGAAPEPDDCVLVDFQIVCCQPPAADVMMLLNCNLEAQYRQNNLIYFLNHYYDQLKTVLLRNNINIDDIMTRESFISSAKKFNQWGLVVYASFVQITWPDDNLVAEVVKDSERFQEAMTKDKKSFMIYVMEKSDEYKTAILGAFEEIIDEYIL